VRTCAAVAALALVLAGCSASASVSIGSSQLSASKLEALVKTVTKQQHFPDQSASCPSGVGDKKGRLSYCTAHYADGESSRFLVRQLDDKGNVTVLPAEMTAPALENDIRLVLRHRGIAVTARCPAHVPIVVGHSFLCTIKDARQTAVLPVKITTASGGFTLGTTRSS
jgi:hypothetical protein